MAPALIVCTHAQTPEAIARLEQIGAGDLQHCAEIGAESVGVALGVY